MSTSDIERYELHRSSRDPEFRVHLAIEETKLAVARRVRALRESRGLTQAELAGLVGTKQPAIARLENARVVPSLEILVKISLVTGVPLASLFEP